MMLPRLPRIPAIRFSAFGSNLFLRILALALAIAIWYVAVRPSEFTNKELQFSVPYALVNLPPDLIITKRSNESITVNLNIGRVEMKDIFQESTRVNLNMEDATTGEYELQISSSDIQAPDGTRITYINPSVLRFSIEKNITKTLPVEVDLVGTPPEGYTIGEVRVTPDSITLNGAQSVLEKQKSVKTSPVDISGRRFELRSAIALLVPDLTTRDSAYTSAVFEVFVPIRSLPENKIFNNIPIAVIGHNYITRINPKTFNVVISGPKSELEYLSSTDLTAYVNLSDYTPGNYKIATPDISLPAGVSVSKSWPPIDIWILNQKIYDN